jgi:hypothetical protein
LTVDQSRIVDQARLAAHRRTADAFRLAPLQKRTSDHDYCAFRSLSMDATAAASYGLPVDATRLGQRRANKPKRRRKIMLKRFAVVLLACTSAGSVDARSAGGVSLAHALFPTCPEGLVKAICVCRAADGSERHQLCQSDRYCRTVDGVCRERARASVSQRHITLRSHAAPIHP